MKRVRFLMVGGFLGAGKTTAIARLARHYIQQGRKVGLVTNDQAYNLVDTQSLRAQGFQVGEVPGACFCCKFDDLVSTAEQLEQDQLPDVLIAEPVGSCTDLVATVIEPLRHLYGERYEIGPLAVLLKPEHGQKILRHEQGVGFSPKAEYIFLKQIEEADIVAVNKVDKLSDEQRDELLRLVAQRFPQKQVLAMSARRGDDFQQLVDLLEQTPREHTSFMEVDYDVYAEGEAELGWLNCQVQLKARAVSFGLDQLLLNLVAALRETLLDADAEPAHLKVLGQVGDQTAIANLVGSNAEVELSLASALHCDQAELWVNARVATDPEQLERLVRDVVHQQAERSGIEAEITGMQRFRPGRPTPTHRRGAGL